ncbi:MAG: thioesterase family protein [Victivallaceae bacterium]|nr:thioesterase family protein [Victivallaceae bacterium]
MMFHNLEYRVPYADTDQMGVVYYANYLEYFERSRTEMLRECGLPYRLLEEEGVIMPVSEAHCYYHAPAHYDDLLTLRSQVAQIKGVRITIESEVRCAGKLLVSGSVVLACVNREHRPVRVPEKIIESCEKYKKESLTV